MVHVVQVVLVLDVECFAHKLIVVVRLERLAGEL